MPYRSASSPTWSAFGDAHASRSASRTRRSASAWRSATNLDPMIPTPTRAIPPSSSGGRDPPPSEKPRQVAILPRDEQRRRVEDRRVGARDDADQQRQREEADRHAAEYRQRAKREEHGQRGRQRPPQRLQQAVVHDVLER